MSSPPDKMFHGTATPFDWFRHPQGGGTDAGVLGEGVYLTKDPEIARSYATMASGSQPRVITAEHGVRNPLVLRSKDRPVVEAAAKMLGVTESPVWDGNKQTSRAWSQEFRERALAAGYDGVYAAEAGEMVAFDPDFVKITKSVPVGGQGHGRRVMRASKEAIAADLLGRYQITELPNGFIRVSDKVSGLEHLVKSGERMPSSVRSRLQLLQGHGSTPEQYMETLRDAARREFTPEFSKMVLDAEKFHSGRAPSPAGVSLLAPSGHPRQRAATTFNRLAPKALATGVAAKLMLGGAAKAAGLPGVGEAAEMAGREDPSLQQFFREQEEGITGALGLPQRSQMPVYSMDPAREGAARVMLRTGRENLRPGFDQPAITKQELEYVKKKAAPRAK